MLILRSSFDIYLTMLRQYIHSLNVSDCLIKLCTTFLNAKKASYSDQKSVLYFKKIFFFILESDNSAKKRNISSSKIAVFYVLPPAALKNQDENYRLALV